MPDVVHAQEIKNVRFYQDSNKIIITYDLISTSRGLFDVTAYYTIDNGKTFIPLISTAGDIGKDIEKGENKKIIWNVLDDNDGIINEIQFKIVANRQKIEDYLILNVNLFPDGIGGNLLYGWFINKKTGILISGNYDYYDYYVDYVDYYYFYGNNYVYKYIGINFGLMYKLLNNPKFKLICYGQLGLNITVPMNFEYFYGDHYNSPFNLNTYIFKTFEIFGSGNHINIYNNKSSKNYITFPFPISTGLIFNINRFNILTGIKIYNNKTKKFKELDEYIQNEYNVNLKYIPPHYAVGLSLGIGYTF